MTLPADLPEWERPHIIYRKDGGLLPGEVVVRPTYEEAYWYWKTVSRYDDPYLIAVVGRTIDPGTPIVDVNE